MDTYADNANASAVFRYFNRQLQVGNSATAKDSIKSNIG